MHDRDVIELLAEILVAGRGGGPVDLSKPPFTTMTVEGAAKELRRRGRGSRRARLPLPKPKRKVSAYQREFGRQLKKLKRAHPRTPVTKLMKRAHAATKRARRGK